MALAIFDKIAVPRIRRTRFSMNHYYTGSGNMSDIIPVLCQPVLPHDTWNLNSEVFLRFSPMIAPIMHEVNVYCYYFFVPLRLIWEDFGEFMTGGKDGNQSPVFPTISVNKDLYGQYPLLDYIGYNRADSNVTGSQSISSLRFRGYQAIYNEYFRNKNLEDPIDFSIGSGSDASYFANLCSMRQIGWEKDYFTACLPSAQRGDPVQLPLVGNPVVTLKQDSTNSGLIRNMLNPPTSGPFGTLQVANDGKLINSQASGVTQAYDPNGTLTIQGLGASTIEELRRAYASQRFQERSMLGGDTYQDFIYAFFGIRGSDARFQKPEYLGGFKSPVVISEVLQTSETGTTPQGGMAGHAVSASAGHGMRQFHAEEYGYLYAMMFVRPRSVYQQGLDRDFTKFDRTEFGLPVFAHLGEQAVKKQEIYNDPSDNKNSEDFGYLPRYTEYKQIPSSIHGAFKNTLDDWHLGRIFSSRPVLNGDFVHTQVNEMTRIFNNVNPSDEHIYFQVLHNGSAKRALPKYSTPTI